MRTQKPARPESRVKVRKSGGDDRYSWALFIDGREKWNGMSRDEAAWRRKQEIEALRAKTSATSAA